MRAILPKLIKVYEGISEDYLGLVAAGVAFYFLMAAFPALAAAISLYGIYADPHFISEQIKLLSDFLPPSALEIIGTQAESLASQSGQTLGISFIVTLVLAIYSATKGVDALIKGLNIAYNDRENRGFFKKAITGYMLTFVLMSYLIAALSLIAGLPVIFNLIHLPEITQEIYLWFRWPLLLCTALIGLEILYFHGPAHKNPKWHWISFGSATATVLWLIISYLFSVFVAHFGNYNETYGSISAIIVLLLWFWLSALTILIGAEVNVAFHPSESGDATKTKNEKL